MPFDWREYLELAKHLGGQASSGYSAEAAERSAVSRAYYAAFCWVRNYAEATLGFRRIGTARDHERLRDLLKSKYRLQVASNLNRLRGWRNDCDYEERVPGLGQRVKGAVSIAGKIIQQCR